MPNQAARRWHCFYVCKFESTARSPSDAPEREREVYDAEPRGVVQQEAAPPVGGAHGGGAARSRHLVATRGTAQRGQRRPSERFDETRPATGEGAQQLAGTEKERAPCALPSCWLQCCAGL